MLATTRYQLTQPLTLEQGDAPGTFGVVNRDASAVILITVEAVAGTIDDVTLYANGDSVSFELEDVRRITISSQSPTDGSAFYPASIAILQSNLPITLLAAPALSSSPTAPVYVEPVRAGSSTAHNVISISDATYSELIEANAARLGLTVYLPPTAGASLSVALGGFGQPTVMIAPGGYYEVPFNYVGELLAKYETGGSGSVYLTEMEA